MAEPIAEVPAQPAQPLVAGSYVPAPVAFITGDEEEDDYEPGGGGYGPGDGGTGQGAVGASGRQDAARTAPEKAFDVSAPRRRPVVFEEEDDLDVPDFLK
jgi:hypothetical protein